jgi:hypothetical protein
LSYLHLIFLTFLQEKQNETLVLDSQLINQKQLLEKANQEGNNIEQSVYELELADKLKVYKSFAMGYLPLDISTVKLGK